MRFRSAAAILALCLAWPVGAQEAEWVRLTREAMVLSDKGDYRGAITMGTQALEFAEKRFGPDHANVASSLHNLGSFHQYQGRYAEAEPLFERAQGLLEKRYGPEHPRVAMSAANFGAMLMEAGRYPQAEAQYKRSLRIWEALGQDGENVAYTLSRLGKLYELQGAWTRAEPIYKRALEILETRLGPNHPSLSTALGNLAYHYSFLGKYEQAEALYVRAVALMEQSVGPDHPDLASRLHNMALLYLMQDQYAKAEPIYKRALAINTRALGPDHPEVAKQLSDLAVLNSRRGSLEEAEALLKRALPIMEKALGPNHPTLAKSLSSLGLLYEKQRRYAEAEPVFVRALAISREALGGNHPEVASKLNNLGALYYSGAQDAPALRYTREATAIYAARIADAGTDDAAVRESAQNRSGFRRHVSLLGTNQANEPRERIVDESFRVAQLEHATGTSAALLKMAARFAAGDDELAELLKRKQDAVDLRAKHEAALVAAAAQAPKDRKAPQEQRVREEIAGLGATIAKLDVDIRARFPQYDALIESRPLEVRKVQALLQPDEAILVYSIGEISSWAWVVRPHQAAFLRLNVKEEPLSAAIGRIRSQMTPDDGGRLKPVDLKALHALYQAVVAPAVPELQGVRNIILVPTGSLQSLPFHMLVASPPAENAAYRDVDWLAKHYAMSLLPSVGSIRALREFAKRTGAQEPFAGFGDPQLTDAPGPRRTLAAPTARQIFSGKPSMRQADVADVRAIKAAPSLPETADELRAMAKSLKSAPQTVWLRDKATEAAVKKIDLSRYRVIAFATHGVMGGELSGTVEPGLILTPPAVGTRDDDGYLSSGEIAQLRLNADWVLLSACNTAASDGTPGAEGLSGLAKAFFYAGSRALLVSHWPVLSQATVPLTTAMLREYEANRAAGKAEAHRKAMLQLMATPGRPEYAHPIVWAPFVVVGD